MNEGRSAIYEGWVRHRRFMPSENAFRYRVFMLYLDLDELPKVLSLSRWWSEKRWSPARFRREDFHGDPRIPLKQAVLRTVETKTGRQPDGPVCMLANMRYFGYVINPLCTYYCFDSQNNLDSIVAEVTNTPWGEKHAYVLRCDTQAQKQRIEFDKRFHVSPFNPLDMSYRWYSNTPSDSLFIHLENWRDQKKVMDASVLLKAVPISPENLNQYLIRFPWMTVKIAAGIYWQAAKLCWKRVPTFQHPKNYP